MKKVLKLTGITAAVLFVIIGLAAVDNFYYPFSAVSPNFSDVEKAFAKLEFPADWKEISSSENRGLHGRGCDPLNDSGCFHKSKIFTVTDINDTKLKIKELFSAQGCASISEGQTYEGNSNQTPKTVSEFSCTIKGGVRLSASVSQQQSQIYVGAKTY